MKWKTPQKIPRNISRQISLLFVWFLCFTINILRFIHKSFLQKNSYHPRVVIREGNGTPLQYSCLENPMDGGAWQAAVHGGHEELKTTEQLHFHFSLSCIGEGNGNPLQCSCLENSTDRGAWWAAVYGFTHSWTRLKRLSSSSSREVILS